VGTRRTGCTSSGIRATSPISASAVPLRTSEPGLRSVAPSVPSTCSTAAALPVAATTGEPHRPPRRPRPPRRIPASSAPEDCPRLPLDAQVRPRHELRAEEDEHYLRLVPRRAALTTAADRPSPSSSSSTGSASPAGPFPASPTACSKGSTVAQGAEGRARGYRSTRKYIAMIYLTVGELDLAATHPK